MQDPTAITYDELTVAYDHFNARLFDGQLPKCLITMQRKGKTFGYFAGARFATHDGTEVTDEIALNPAHFRSRSIGQSLSTLVREMVHLQQYHHGKPSRAGYHNRQWATLMRLVGLVPSSTGTPGGKQIGQHVGHYVEPGGRFERACQALLAGGFVLPYADIGQDGEARKKKAASKTKYICPGCAANAWAKPETQLVCGACRHAMEASDA
jgi:predicted SprT family Zn-dependent metalloprotease